MIAATLQHGDARITLTWTRADGLRLDGDPALANELRVVFQPDTIGWYNPRKGGLYGGFDPADPVQVRDGLAYLSRQLQVTIEQEEQTPPAIPVRFAAPGGIDWRDEAAVAAAKPSPWEALFPPFEQRRERPAPPAPLRPAPAPSASSSELRKAAALRVVASLLGIGLAGLLAKAPGAQLSLFGRPSAPAPAPAAGQATHEVRQHVALNPGGLGVHVVTQHVAHHTPAVTPPPPPPPAPQPVAVADRAAIPAVDVVVPKERIGPLTTREARGLTFHDLATTAGEWEPAEIDSFEVVDTGRGEGQAMPVFDLPDGYTPVTTRFSGGQGDDMACELCGATIKRAYYILHHDRKLSMRVGSRCIENHTDAIMPDQVQAVKKTLAVRIKPEEVEPVNALLGADVPAQVAIARVRARLRANAKFLEDNPRPTEAQEALWRQRQERVRALRERQAAGGYLSRDDYGYLRDQDYLRDNVPVEDGVPSALHQLQEQYGIPNRWQRAKGAPMPEGLPSTLLEDLEAAWGAHEWTPELRERLARHFPGGRLPTTLTSRRVLPDYAAVGVPLATSWEKLRASTLEEAERTAAVRTDPAVVQIGEMLDAARAGSLTPEQEEILTRRFDALPPEKRRKANGNPIKLASDKALAVLAHVKEVAERAPLVGLQVPSAPAPTPAPAPEPSPATDAGPAPAPTRSRGGGGTLHMQDVERIRAADTHREALQALDRKHAREHAEALANHLREAGIKAANVWEKEGMAPRVYFPNRAGFVSVAHDGTLEDAPRGRRSLDEGALYPGQRKALAQARATYLAQLGERLNRQTQERVALVEQADQGAALSKAMDAVEAALELLKATQLGLFGAPAASAAPPPPAATGRARRTPPAQATAGGVVHQVRTYTRQTAHGPVVVQAHQAHHAAGQGGSTSSTATPNPSPTPAPAPTPPAPARPAPDARVELPESIPAHLRETFQGPTFAEAQRDHGAEDEDAHRVVTLALARKHFHDRQTAVTAHHVQKAIEDLHGAIAARMTPQKRKQLGPPPDFVEDIGEQGNNLSRLLDLARKHKVPEAEIAAHTGGDERLGRLEQDLAPLREAERAITPALLRARQKGGLWRAQRGRQHRVNMLSRPGEGWKAQSERARMVEELRHHGFQAHLTPDDGIVTDAPTHAHDWLRLASDRGVAWEAGAVLHAQRAAHLALHGHPEHGDQRGSLLTDPYGGRSAGMGRVTWASPEAAEAAYHHHTGAAGELRRQAANTSLPGLRGDLNARADDYERVASAALEDFRRHRRNQAATPMAKAEYLHGGRADGMDPRAFDQHALYEGIRHEMEHTSNRRIAQEIAMDHLAEDANYYRKLRVLVKTGKLAGRPGLHLDPEIHRWVRDEDIRPGAVFPSPLGRLQVEHADHEHAEIRPVEGGSSVRVPRASASHFFNDLAGSLAGHTPTSGNPHVDRVIRENGEWIGKGEDGIVFRAGPDHVVKVSTTVPFQPFNQGHRTPEEAAEHLGGEARAHAALAGIPHVPEVTVHQHEGRTWIVKPYLDDVGQLTAGEADSVRDAVRAMHARGWALGDQVQLGRDARGQVQIMDLGQAHPLDPSASSRSRGPLSADPRERDEERLAQLYREHGHTYYPTGEGLRRAESAGRLLLGMALKHGDRQRAEAHYLRWKAHAGLRAAELAASDDFDAWNEHHDRVDEIERRMAELRASGDPALAKAGEQRSLFGGGGPQEHVHGYTRRSKKTGAPIYVPPHTRQGRLRHFASGSQQTGLPTGFAEVGKDVGVAALDVRPSVEAELKRLAGRDVHVFVDSGAFSEVAFGPEGPRTVRPFTAEDWERVLGLYERLAPALREQLHVVAPDKVGDQGVTLERLRTYAGRMRALRDDYGVNILVPLQQGQRSLADFDREVEVLFGDRDYIPSIPSKKDATPTAALIDYVRERRPARLHLLGLGPDSPRAEGVLDSIHRTSPETVVQMDSNIIRAAVGRPEGGPPRKFTAGQDQAADEIAYEAWTGSYTDPEDGYGRDMTEEIMEPSLWMSVAQRQSFAAAAGMPPDVARRFVLTPDSVLLEPMRADDGEGEDDGDDGPTWGEVFEDQLADAWHAALREQTARERRRRGVHHAWGAGPLSKATVRRLAQLLLAGAALAKGAPIQGRPGLHLDPAKHRWVRGDGTEDEHNYEVHVRDTGSGPEVTVHHRGHVVGSASFTGVWEHETAENGEAIYDYDHEEHYHVPRRRLVGLRAWDVAVHPDHRRKGLATAMYAKVQAAHPGVPLLPGQVQTPDGRAFRASFDQRASA